MFNNRVLWRIFGTKRDDVRGGWRKLDKGELLHLIYHTVQVNSL
jgi:hypothetical protein